MKEGDVILTPIPQADGEIKNRPALFLRQMPPFNDALVCGISTQLHQKVEAFDQIINAQDADFVSSGLVQDSLIRLGFLAIIPRNRIIGSIGSVSPGRRKHLLQTLSEYLTDGDVP
jgi:mRNA interferase MazF